jgi:ATP-binding cassette subfamily B protein
VLALAFLVLIILDFVFNFVQKVLMEFTGHRLMHDLRVTLYRHIQGLSVSFFSKNPVGRLVTRVTNDIQNMHELFTTVIAFVFNDICLLVGIAVVLASINLELTAVGFMVLPLVWFAAIRFARRARNIFRILRIKIAEINTRFSESIGGMKVIQMFRHEAENYARFRKLNHDNYQAGMDQIRLMAIFMPLIEVLGTTAVACVVYYGGGRVLSNHISIGELVVFISYIRMFFRPIRDVAEKYNIVQNALASAERIFLILDSQETLSLPPDARRSRTCSESHGVPFSSLTFESVSFSYLPGEPVIRNISFHLAAGQTLGIVGPTGSGKTTLINLMTRFYDPTGGRVTINGQDLKTLPPETYRCRMALVMQDPFLFSGTIRENILGGNGGHSGRTLENILKAANCMELVNRAPQGLDTPLSEAGGSISSGERQLISIARAFARNPELIVMDEATSYIDSQTEHKIQDAMFNLMENRTAVVVAHRLATVRHLDRILVIRKGRIIESGSHGELMAKQGVYFGLHRTGASLH